MNKVLLISVSLIFLISCGTANEISRSSKKKKDYVTGYSYMKPKKRHGKIFKENTNENKTNTLVESKPIFIEARSSENKISIQSEFLASVNDLNVKNISTRKIILPTGIINDLKSGDILKTSYKKVKNKKDFSNIKRENSESVSEKGNSTLKIIGWILIALGLLVAYFASILGGGVLLLIGLAFVLLGGMNSTTGAKKRTSSPEYVDVVYLKNGASIRGMIIEQIPNKQIKIRTADGSIFVYKMEEVEKITKEENN